MAIIHCTILPKTAQRNHSKGRCGQLKSLAKNSMNKIVYILPLFILTIIGCKTQENKPTDFIPKGYVEFEKHFGDLNKDGLEDCVLIIKKTDATNIVINQFDKK